MTDFTAAPLRRLREFLDVLAIYVGAGFVILLLALSAVSLFRLAVFGRTVMGDLWG